MRLPMSAMPPLSELRARVKFSVLPRTPRIQALRAAASQK